MSGKRLKNGTMTNTHKIVWFGLANGVAWVWCSYILAFLGRYEIASDLSEKAIVEIVGVVMLYCVKALLEKRESFGAVGKRDL